MGTRILLVDDEVPLLALLKKYLERLGYEVEACLTPTLALSAFEDNPANFDLVLTDLTLPDMKGDEMIERMRGTAPTLRAIITSGYPYHPKERLTGFLQKPFLPKMLAEEIERILKS